MAITINIIIFLLYLQIISILCITSCNKNTILVPKSEYHCSGLEISNITHENDTHCCLWEYYDTSNSKYTTRCSSINQYQFDNLKAYIEKKNNQGYTNLTITCTADQKLYCSNVVLDEDKIEDCRELAIPFEDDMFCCRWNFTDSSNHNKNNNYCASINEYEYLTIKDYIRYKSNHPLQRYDQLTIDCYSTTIKKPLLLLLLFFLIK